MSRRHRGSDQSLEMILLSEWAVSCSGVFGNIWGEKMLHVYTFATHQWHMLS